jgi:hypothetical protein
MRKRRRSNFVPRLLFRAAFVGVVPACVAACGSSGGGGVHDLAHGDGFFSVAAPLDFAQPGDAIVAVADAAFSDGGDGGDVDAAQRDQFFTVAAPLDFAVPPPQKG